MSFKKAVIGMGIAMAMFTSGALAGTPQVFLSVVDTVLYPNGGSPIGTNRLLTVRMNNPVVHVGGFSVSLSISEPAIINFGFTTIDTVPPYWRHFTDCAPPPCHPDSVYECPDTCFNYNAQVITQGTRSATFDFMHSDRLSEIVLQVNGIAQTSGGGPVLQPGNGVLFRVPLSIFPISDTFSLSQRQVKIYFDSIYTSVSDSTGNFVWRADTSNTLSLTYGTVTIPYPMRGDINFDGTYTPTDLALELSYIFVGYPPPPSGPAVADVNCDGRWTPTDVVREINKIYLGVPLPC